MLEAALREERGLVLASLIRSCGDFDLAEDALQEAVLEALVHWRHGVPARPAAWLLTTARRKAIDRSRREAARPTREFAAGTAEAHAMEIPDDGPIPDERLRLIFTCCHPAIPPDARVALTLRTLGGLATPEIARAFLVPEATMAQRIVRAKRKIATAHIPYRVPPPEQLPERLASVLAVIYLIFNEGYSASTGDSVVRRELCREAIRLSEVLDRLIPSDSEITGLLALMLLHDARREARLDQRGDLVLLPDQDREKWDREQIAHGLSLVESALRLALGNPGQYALQAAIAALHAEAESPDAVDWPQIAALYNELRAVLPTPIVELNRAVAISMADGPAAALPIVETLAEHPALARSYLLFATRADLLRRLDRRDEAAESYRKAFELAPTAPERVFLERRYQQMVTETPER